MTVLTQNGLLATRSGVMNSGAARVGSITAGSSFMSSPGSMLRAGVPGTGAEESAEEVFDLESGTEATEGSAAADAMPEVAIAQMAQHLGGSLNTIITGIQNYNINADYVNTMSTGHGIGLVQMAQNQASARYANSSLEDLGGKLGAMFGGPLGALAGRGLASLFETPITGAVAYTQNGEIDPQANGTPQSQSAQASNTTTPTPQAQPSPVSETSSSSSSSPSTELTTFSSNADSSGSDSSSAIAETSV